MRSTLARHQWERRRLVILCAPSTANPSPAPASACKEAVHRSLAQPQALCHRPLRQPLTQPQPDTSRILRIDNLLPGISSPCSSAKDRNYLRLKTVSAYHDAAPPDAIVITGTDDHDRPD